MANGLWGMVTVESPASDILSNLMEPLRLPMDTKLGWDSQTDSTQYPEYSVSQLSTLHGSEPPVGTEKRLSATLAPYKQLQCVAKEHNFSVQLEEILYLLLLATYM